ncbi:phosphatase PAP2 family protein [Spirosoma linguale]|uniref:Phosphoesterase PA-phosphatase related protein n=1 Tax=Spirosoma linguale (strain ATCC 33905 / DSM 74 / LMG 10896 / Claus 1) TaxID=504472 RepID=D2QT00_SPILD|nr:phosphoesterase PA-phosphatase related protein [Spirosoma linguale DSM 74]
MVIDFLRKNRLFFLPYAFLLLLFGVLQLIYSQEQLMQWVNTRNSAAADALFPYITYLGDGIFFAAVCLLLVFLNRRIGLMAFASFALSSLTSEFLKKVVFKGSPRPLKYFEHSSFQYHLIEGLDIFSYNSFPSGHTITAFALFGLMAFLDENKSRGWIWLLLGVLAGYSRVYLFQHFVEDVFVGSLVGTISSIIIFQLMYGWATKAKTSGDN